MWSATGLVMLALSTRQPCFVMARQATTETTFTRNFTSAEALCPWRTSSTNSPPRLAVVAIACNGVDYHVSRALITCMDIYTQVRDDPSEEVPHLTLVPLCSATRESTS